MDNTAVELQNINQTLKEISGKMPEPNTKFERIMEIAGNAVGIVSVLAIIDIIRNWILGG